MKKILILLFFVFFVLSFSQAEEITLTTYYPSPAGIYQTLEVLNDNEQILIGNDPNSPAIELRDRDADGTTPYIDFSNDAASNYDFRLILKGNNNFWVSGGTTTFADNADNPANIRVSEVWFCSSY